MRASISISDVSIGADAHGQARRIGGRSGSCVGPPRHGFAVFASRRTGLAALLIALAASIQTPSARAGEAILSATPIGGNDFGAALLPGPGWYGAFALVPGRGRDSYDTYGNRNAGIDARMEAYTVGAALMYVYPFEIAGGRVSTLVQASATSVRVRLDPVFYEKTSGIDDLYVDVFKWSRHLGRARQAEGEDSAGGWSAMPLGWNLSLGLAMKVPVGRYDAGNYVNTGSNLWIFSPNVGVTWLSTPGERSRGPWEVSARMYYSIPLRNDDTDYKTGEVVGVDWAVGKYLSPSLQVGITGAYQEQLSADSPPSGSAPLVNGNRYANASAGPVVSYVLPRGLGAVRAKYLFPQFIQKNGIKSEVLVLSYSRAF